MQAVYYISLGSWIIILDLILHSDLSLGQIYSFEVSVPAMSFIFWAGVEIWNDLVL